MSNKALERLAGKFAWAVLVGVAVALITPMARAVLSDLSRQ
jgi:hypothetical protein